MVEGKGSRGHVPGPIASKSERHRDSVSAAPLPVFDVSDIQFQLPIASTGSRSISFPDHSHSPDDRLSYSTSVVPLASASSGSTKYSISLSSSSSSLLGWITGGGRGGSPAGICTLRYHKRPARSERAVEGKSSNGESKRGGLNTKGAPLRAPSVLTLPR